MTLRALCLPKVTLRRIVSASILRRLAGRQGRKAGLAPHPLGKDSESSGEHQQQRLLCASASVNRAQKSRVTRLRRSARTPNREPLNRAFN
jgi:hypothetical protein